jgi:hypothetical protein
VAAALAPPRNFTARALAPSPADRRWDGTAGPDESRHLVLGAVNLSARPRALPGLLSAARLGRSGNYQGSRTVDQIRTAASQIWTAAGIAIKIVRAVMTHVSQSIAVVCRLVAF